MKAQHQNTWQVAKLVLVALVVALGAVACSSGSSSSSSSGGGTSATIAPRAPTAMPSTLSSGGFFTFNVVVDGTYNSANMVFKQSSDATITASDTTVTNASVTKVTNRTVNDDSTTEVTAEVYAASTGYYGVCVGNACSDGVLVTVTVSSVDCTVGDVLAAGESCTLSGGGVVSVNSSGTQVCLVGGFCSGTGGLTINSLSVSKVTGGYRIDSL